MKDTIRHRLLLFNIFIFISSILLCGCSNDKIELNEISIVTGIGIDKISGDKPFLVTLEIIDPKSSRNNNNVSQKGNNSIIKTSTGKSIFDAIQDFSKIILRLQIFHTLKQLFFQNIYVNQEFLKQWTT